MLVLSKIPESVAPNQLARDHTAAFSIRITRKTGVFDTKHFKMGEGSDFWVDVRDGVLVRLSYGPAGTRYDLTAYERNN